MPGRPVFQTIRCEQDDGVLTITLNRPDVMNALTAPMLVELKEVFKAAGKDERVRCIILTGAGRAFCSGQDLKEVAGNPDRSLGESIRERYNPLIRRMRNLPKPIIGAVNGVAAGAGLSLALACDYRVASEDARLVEVFIRIGLVPDSGSSYFLPHLIGYARAFELCTTGREIGADEAVRLGLVNDVVSCDELLSAAKKMAERYAKAPTKAIGQVKAMLNRAMHASLDEALDYEMFQQEVAGRSEDYREGVAAFLEKRTPVFKGR